ncbi:MAG: hypothetical protein UR26_C0001G0184 [candidate division TM6 bacterium GW2011_GWF2_32_72]|nr:MAG: hypothetical protein UR26_C0001G0184 [candidate division TM6 bacterium GW2011_GWF2_32_72]
MYKYLFLICSLFMSSIFCYKDALPPKSLSIYGVYEKDDSSTFSCPNLEEPLFKLSGDISKLNVFFKFREVLFSRLRSKKMSSISDIVYPVFEDIDGLGRKTFRDFLVLEEWQKLATEELLYRLIARFLERWQELINLAPEKVKNKFERDRDRDINILNELIFKVERKSKVAWLAVCPNHYKFKLIRA